MYSNIFKSDQIPFSMGLVCLHFLRVLHGGTNMYSRTDHHHSMCADGNGQKPLNSMRLEGSGSEMSQDED